jgi:hypothetical protein
MKDQQQNLSETTMQGRRFSFAPPVHGTMKNAVCSMILIGLLPTWEQPSSNFVYLN